MESQDMYRKTTEFVRNSATIKLLIIGLLLLVLLIPSSMISSLISERESRKESVIQEINQKWGGSQCITGPYFLLPYKSYYKDKDDELKYNIHHMHLLPEKVEISGEIEPQIRYRGIYEAVLYESSIMFNGSFASPDLSRSNISAEDILWDKAVFSIGITDMKGIRENILIRFDGEDFKATPGLKTDDIAASGVKAQIPFSRNEKDNSFSWILSIRHYSLSFLRSSLSCCNKARRYPDPKYVTQ